MIPELTIGGLTSSDEWMSDKARAHDFGRIIVALASEDSSEQRRAYIKYYEFRRLFTRHYWSTMLDRLDDWREITGHRSVRDLLREIGARVHRTEPVADPDPILVHDALAAPQPIAPQASWKVEQIDLFG